MSTYNFNYIDSNLIEDTKKAAAIDYLAQDKSLSFIRAENATILPYKNSNDIAIGGVQSYDGRMIEGIWYDYSTQEIIKNNSVAIYLGYWTPNVWGHCITDMLNKIWFIIDDYYKQYESENTVFLFLSSGNTSLNKSFCEMLSYLSINSENLFLVDKLTRFKTVYIPDDCLFYLPTDIKRLINQRNGLLYYTSVYQNIINRITSTIPTENFSKVYFSGSRSKNKKTWNEKSIEEIFCRNGFSVFFPEDLSFFQQIAILKGCQQFACTESSISHNAVFLNKQCELIIIRKAIYHNEYQYMINHLKDLHVTYIDAHMSIFLNQKYCYDGPFFLYVNENLINFIHDKWSKDIHIKFPHRLFQQYFKWCLSLHALNFSNCLDKNDIYYSRLNDLIQQQPFTILCNNIRKTRHLLGKIKRQIIH